MKRQPQTSHGFSRTASNRRGVICGMSAAWSWRWDRPTSGMEATGLAIETIGLAIEMTDPAMKHGDFP